jgi:MFS family permease
VIRSGGTATHVRYHIIGVSMLMAFILYLDRICLGEIVKSASFKSDVSLTKEQIGRILGAFFFTYALVQVPAGWASDRFGPRRMLSGYICLWSFFTGLTGCLNGFLGLLLARLGCGLAEAGAYPTSGAVIRRWIPLEARARASSMVTFGGRIGGTLAPYLTALLIINLGSWRAALWADATVGLIVACAYWMVVRNRPEEHPRCNNAERELIGPPPRAPGPSARELALALGTFCRSRSLWLLSAGQFFTNIGWAFLITWLPTYLAEGKRIEAVQGAKIVTLSLGVGMFGQLAGGWLCDEATRRIGLRWGRVLPMCMASVVAGLAYLGCLAASSVSVLVACCALVSFATDVANPGVWAFTQDVGGRATAAAAGWSNMWGNFGASISAMMVPHLLKTGVSSESGQRMVFIACASSFFLAAVAYCGMDATKPLLRESNILSA